jgi:hypothetical protein
LDGMVAIDLSTRTIRCFLDTETFLTEPLYHMLRE